MVVKKDESTMYPPLMKKVFFDKTNVKSMERNVNHYVQMLCYILPRPFCIILF